MQQPISVSLDRLRPTQAAVGMRAVAAKRKRLKAKGDKLADFLHVRPIPAVRGPRQMLWIVDRHHMTLALQQSGVETAFAKVIGDLSDLSMDEFWDHMLAASWVYPYCENGERVSHRRIPASMTCLKADPYRDLAWSVREAGGFAKSPQNFSEFKWANYFRTSIDPRVVDEDYDRAISLALRLARSSNASHLPGFIGAVAA